MHPLRLLLLVVVVSLAASSAAQPFFFTRRTLDLPTNDIVYEPASGLLYASVPSTSAHPLSNRIVAIDPATATIVRSVVVGSEPGPLALSDDGSVLWVGLDGARAIRRVELPALSPGLQFPVGEGSFGADLAEDIAVQPGTRDVIAVSRRNDCCSPGHEGIAVYDNGVQRPAKTPGHTGPNRIEFSDSADFVYGYNNETSAFAFERIAITAAGASRAGATGLLYGYGLDIVADQGRIYATSGAVVDPATLSLLGTYDAHGPVRPAADRGLVFFLEGPYLRIFDLDSFVWLQDFFVGISSSVEALGRMVGWGEEGLAVRIGDRFTSNRILLLTVSAAPVPDTDGDGRRDPDDNCPEQPNPDQGDRDGDRTGDACDRFPEDPDNLGACVDSLDASAAELSALETRVESLTQENASLANALADVLARIDTDRDGVPDAKDACADSRRNGQVDGAGCQPWQRVGSRARRGLSSP